MKLLVLASAGGEAHRRTLQALVSDAARNDEVRVLAPDAEGRALRALGVPVESWKPAGLFNVLRSTGALRRAVEHQAPDVIHAVGWTAAAVALGTLSSARSARTLVTLLDPIVEGEMPKAFVEKRLPELLPRAGFVTCAYATLAREAVEHFGVDAERLQVIAPGVAPALEAGVRRPPERPGPIVGYLGRLDVDKTWQSAIDALTVVKRSFPYARLRFAFTGPLRHLVRAYARVRGVLDDITLFDDLPTREFFGGIDLAVVPRGRDGLPYPLLQTLVDGVPVLATNHDGLADTLGPYATGWLVPHGGPGLAAGILDAWPRIDEAWSGAQEQRPRAVAAYDPRAVAERFASIRAQLVLAADEETPPPLARGAE